MICEKDPYPNKKSAKRAAKALSFSDFGSRAAKFSAYHCKSCNSWHTCTNNRSQLKYNSQHARGGRRSRRGRRK